MDHTTITIENLQAIAPRVLQALNSIAKLPSNGTVAGQAVASLVWKELGLPMQGPVNDIDVFVNFQMPVEDRGLKKPSTSSQYGFARPQQKTITNYRKSQIVSDNYDERKILATRDSIVILRSYTVDPVNYTLIVNPENTGVKHTVDISQEIVDEFDLNLVGVGINLDTGTLVASDGFLRFLIDRQVRAQTCNTPAHTLLRLVNKLHSGQLHGVECDYEGQREMLELAIACQDKIAPRLKCVSSASPVQPKCITRFGSEKYRAIAERFASLLPPVEIEKAEDGYEFMRFVPAAPVSEQGRWLLEQSEKLVSGGNIGIGALAYVARFPRLYALFHADSSVEMGDAQNRMASFTKALLQDDPVAVFNLVQSALGNPLPDYQLQQMTPLEAASFLFDQNLSPGELEHVVHAWNALPHFEAKVLLSAKIDCTQFKEVCDDNEKIQDWLFTQSEWTVQQEMKGIKSHDDRPSVAADLASAYVKWLTQKGMKQEKPCSISWVLPAVNVSCLDDSHGYHTTQGGLATALRGCANEPLAQEIIRHAPPEEREALSRGVARAAAVVKVADSQAEALSKEVVYLMMLGLSVDTDMIQQLDNHGQISRTLLRSVEHLDVTPFNSQAWIDLIEAASMQEIVNHDAHVLRSLVSHPGAQYLAPVGSLCNQLANYPEMPGILLRAIGAMKSQLGLMQALNSMSSGMVDNESDEKTRALEKSIAMFSAWKMDMDTPHAQGSSRARPPRL